MVDAEWSILYDKLEAIVKSGAKVVLSKLPIGDVATQYFADRYVQWLVAPVEQQLTAAFCVPLGMCFVLAGCPKRTCGVP